MYPVVVHCLESHMYNNFNMTDLLQLYHMSYSYNIIILNDYISIIQLHYHYAMLQCSYIGPILLNMILKRKFVIHFVSGWHDYYI